MSFGEPGRCGSCCWWEDPDDPTDHAPSGLWGACEMTATDFRAWSWGNRRFWAHRETMAIASGDDDSPHRLWTAREFGCVQWAARG